MNMKLFKGFLLTLLLSFFYTGLLLAQTPDGKWQEIHKVKKKETIFGISHSFGITIDELIDANPVMRQPGYELKKGEVIYIPFHKESPKQEAPKAVVSTPKTVKVGVMLPLHDVDGDGKRMVEYYRGLLLAVKQLKQDNINVTMKAFNVNQDADIQKMLHEDGMTDLDVIFGPLYTKQVKELSEFCRAFHIRMVIPFSINGNEVDRNPYIYQVYQSAEMLNETSVMRYMERFADYHPIIIDCNDSTSTKGVFTSALRKQLEKRGIDYSITNLRSSSDLFAKAFSLTKRNMVILNTGRSPELTMAIRKLTELKEANKNVAISMFGYNDWLAYQKYNNNEVNFCKFDTYIPSYYYYNEESEATQAFVRNYDVNFHASMMHALPHFAVTGYDQGMFFIGGIAKYGEAFKASSKQQYTKPLQTPYGFIQASSSTGYRNQFFQLIHFSEKGIESIAY